MEENKIILNIDPRFQKQLDILLSTMRLDKSFANSLEDAIKLAVLKYMTDIPEYEQQNRVLRRKIEDKEREIEKLTNENKLYKNLYEVKRRFCELVKKAAKEGRIKEVIEV